MSPPIPPYHHDEADPFRVLHDVLGSNQSRTRRRVRHVPRLGSTRRPLYLPSPVDSRSSISDGHTDKVAEGDKGPAEKVAGNDKGPTFDYISDMDWGSPPLPASGTLHADTTRNPPPVSAEVNLSFPQSTKPLRNIMGPPSLYPGVAEMHLRLGESHDWERVFSHWRLLSIHREVELQLAEKGLATRYNPCGELVRNVTVTPVERAPSPPPYLNFYPKDRGEVLADDTTGPTLPLSLIPTERVWITGGHLATGNSRAGFFAPYTGFCSAEMGVVNFDGGGPMEKRQCGNPCQAVDDPFHGGICESTEHHPGARVWVCDYHDKLGRQEAMRDLRHLTASMRHYACAECCRKIEEDETGQFLSHTGWHVFEMQDLPTAFDPTVRITPPATPTPEVHGSRHLARSITRCACATKVADRRLCAPHRLEAVAQMHRWHPSAYALHASLAASHQRKDMARGWAAHPNKVGQSVGWEVTPTCPLCKRSMPVDYFGFRGPLGREGRTIAWVCKACLGVVVGAVASPAWVAHQHAEDRWVDMGLLTKDYPMYPFADAVPGNRDDVEMRGLDIKIENGGHSSRVRL